MAAAAGCAAISLCGSRVRRTRSHFAKIGFAHRTSEGRLLTTAPLSPVPARPSATLHPRPPRPCGRAAAAPSFCAPTENAASGRAELHLTLSVLSLHLLPATDALPRPLRALAEQCAAARRPGTDQGVGQHEGRGPRWRHQRPDLRRHARGQNLRPAWPWQGRGVALPPPRCRDQARPHLHGRVPRHDGRPERRTPPLQPCEQPLRRSAAPRWGPRCAAAAAPAACAAPPPVPPTDPPPTPRSQLFSPTHQLLSPSQDLHFDDIPGGIAAVGAVPAAGWFQIIALIGVHELTVAKQDYTKTPGEINTFLGFKPDDPVEFADKQLKERTPLSTARRSGPPQRRRRRRSATTPAHAPSYRPPRSQERPPRDARRAWRDDGAAGVGHGHLRAAGRDRRQPPLLNVLCRPTVIPRRGLCARR